MNRKCKNIRYILVLSVLGTVTLQCSSAASQPHQFVLEKVPGLIDYSSKTPSICKMLGMATTILEAIALSQPATLLDGAEEERKIKIALGSRVTYAAQLIFNSFLQNMSGNCRYFGMDEGIVSGKRLQLIYLLDSGFKGYIFMAINDEAAMPDTALFEGISLKNCSLITPSWIPPIIDLFQRGKSGK